MELRTTQAQLAERSDQVDALQDELAGSGGRVRQSVFMLSLFVFWYFERDLSRWTHFKTNLRAAAAG